MSEEVELQTVDLRDDLIHIAVLIRDQQHQGEHREVPVGRIERGIADFVEVGDQRHDSSLSAHGHDVLA